MQRWLENLSLKEILVKAIISGLFLILFFTGVHYLKQSSPNRDDAKLNELRQIIAALPTFPDFTEDTTDESSRDTDAGVYKWYCSTASYEAVKNFYTKVLVSRGWSIPGEKDVQRWFSDYGTELIFHKEDFLIAIMYAGSLHRKCKYAISYVWRDKTSSLWRNG